MPRLDLSDAAFARMTSLLCPSGDAWPTESDAVERQAFMALAYPFTRLNARANALVTDAFPRTTIELLPEWEASLGLPNHCTPLAPTIRQRQRAVVAKLIARGGATPAYFIAYAAALGFTITVDQFAPARYGTSKYGDPMNGEAWAHTWAVNAPGTTITNAQFGSAKFGEPYRTWGNAQLVCELNAIKPAHTILLFRYIGPVAPPLPGQAGPAIWDQFRWDSTAVWG